MPKRADLRYPRLTVRPHHRGPWGAWPAPIVVRLLDAPGDRERTLTIQPTFTRAHSAADELVDRFRRAMEETP